MNDFVQVLSLLAGFGLNADQRDWRAVEAAFAPQVQVDYASLTGSPRQQVAADALVKSWQSLLPGFTRTQHLIGLPAVRIDGSRATAQANFLAHHYIEPAPQGGSLWTVGGRYEWTLTKASGSWRIDGLKLAAGWQEGNRELPALASKRVTDGAK